MAPTEKHSCPRINRSSQLSCCQITVFRITTGWVIWSSSRPKKQLPQNGIGIGSLGKRPLKGAHMCYLPKVVGNVHNETASRTTALTHTHIWLYMTQKHTKHYTYAEKNKSPSHRQCETESCLVFHKILHHYVFISPTSPKLISNDLILNELSVL